jgi:acetyl esterase/lipase
MILTAGCAQHAVTAAEPKVASVATESPTQRILIFDDIAYRSGESKAWRLDLAMLEPTDTRKRPAIVIIHGGGWRAGSKRDRAYRDLLLHFALKDYVTLSVDYRLTGEAPIPACLEDVRCAVRWLRAHADQYQVDPDRIGAYGHSAGAHLALMLAMLPASAGIEGDGGWNEYSSRITAVAGGSSPVRLRTRPNMPEPEKWSPMTYISADVPPILLIQGTEDTVVPVASNDEFVEKLKAAGAKDVTYVRIEGGNHGVAYEFFLDRTQKAMDEFFDRTLSNKQPATAPGMR